MTAITFIDCGMADLMLDKTSMVVGVEPHPEEGLKVYVGARWRGIFVQVVGEEAEEAIRSAWATGGKVVIPLPPDDALQQDPIEETA